MVLQLFKGLYRIFYYAGAKLDSIHFLIQFSKMNWIKDRFNVTSIIELSESDNLGDNDNFSMILFWSITFAKVTACIASCNQQRQLPLNAPLMGSYQKFSSILTNNWIVLNSRSQISAKRGTDLRFVVEANIKAL